MPLPIMSASSVADETSFVIVGGYDANDNKLDSVYEFQCSIISGTPLNCQWNKMEQTLENPRHSAVAMLVPDSLIDC